MAFALMHLDRSIHGHFAKLIEAWDAANKALARGQRRVAIIAVHDDNSIVMVLEPIERARERGAA